ncbi:hypothetical protein LSH36_532g01019 [Paralvinella palmiformis]|uniref:Magnesium-dependent phosphatase 1 n=1 Tax=Paralvinella palmiformis TaxID=53620 RepID=A0AAD9MYM9_9ANNE|nr:hypothetical protein LSH36_532g01019 [Paralvinella palmiformis]
MSANSWMFRQNDYTLWPFWTDRLFRNNNFLPGQVNCYPEVPLILFILKSNGFLLGIASRISCIQQAVQLIFHFGWQGYFDYVEVHPGNKKSHFIDIHFKSGIPYRDMLFFDDDVRNIREVSQLGVACFHVSNGMSLIKLHQGLAIFNATP